RVGAEIDAGQREGKNPARARRIAGGRFDERRRRNRAGLQSCSRQFYQRRREPRNPRNRRRFQYRRDEPGRSDSVDRSESKDWGFPERARRRHRQPQGFDDAETRRQGERQLRVSRFGRGSAKSSRPADQRDVDDNREGREDPGGIQSGPGSLVSVDWLRKTVAAEGRF